MVNHKKTCRIHGELTHENIIEEPTARATRGYVLRCRVCRIEASNRQYEKRRIMDDRKRNSSWSDNEKVCQIHGKLTENNIVIRKSTKNKNGKQSRCKKCIIEQNWKTELRRSARNTRTIIRYHSISFDEYQEMFKRQNNLCKICKQPETRRSRTPGEICRLVVDHCHSTQRIRGLLCHACNLMIGYSRDSIEVLQSAIAYLKIT